MDWKLKEKLGCWLHERAVTELVISLPMLAKRLDLNWRDLCNRNESLLFDSFSGGCICRWQDSSELTVTRIFPSVASRLLRHCLKEYPVHLDFSTDRGPVSRPEASVLLPIGGTDRLGQFEVVLASLRGQNYTATEIIVVEQTDSPVLEMQLPDDVVYLNTPACEVGFNRSWGLNVAARQARGRYFFVHDADCVVPKNYVEECVRVLSRANAARPARFIFYMDQVSTQEFQRRRELPKVTRLEKVVQNINNPMAIRAETYGLIGGHDERFFGWGAEDNEFFDRLRTVQIAEGGWLPVIHLWHPPAPQKVSGHRNLDQYRLLSTKDPKERIEMLKQRDMGQLGSPSVDA